MHHFYNFNLINFSLFTSYVFRFDFSKKGLILIDKNGSGKTSVLKAIYLLLTGKSIENERFKNNVKINNLYFKLSIDDFDHFMLYAVNNRSGHFEKKFKRNKNLINPKIFVYFSKYNNWLSLDRQKKLDLFDHFISQADDNINSYEKNLKLLTKFHKNKQVLINKYNKIYKNCLKNNINFEGINQSDRIILDNLNKQIFEVSLIIWEARDSFFAFLINNLKTYQDLIETKIEIIKLRWYKTDFNGNRSPFFDYNKKIDLEKLNFLFLKEVICCRNLFGANRDDFLIEINDKNVNELLSTGEMRLFVLFLIQQFIKLYKLNNPKKVIWWFLDDVFNELDTIRENRIYKKLLNIVNFWFATGTKVPKFYQKNKEKINLTKI